MTTRLHQLKQAALLIVLSFVLGTIDWISGYELNFSVFYFIPVSLAAWSFGALGSVAFAVFCSMIWYGADFLADHTYSNTLYAVWDTMLRLVSFLAIGWAVASLKKNLDIEQETARKLRASLSEIRVLESFLPICAECKKIRDEQGDWHQLEAYISRRTDTRFSHGYCPECYRKALSEAGFTKE